MNASSTWMCTVLYLTVIVTTSQAGSLMSDEKSLDGSTWKSFIRSYVEKTQEKLDVDKQWSENENELISVAAVDRVREQADLEQTEIDSFGAKISRKRGIDEVLPNNCAFLNGGCDHICTRDENADNFYSCSCHTGYQLTADSHSCSKDEFEDRGECADKNGGCAHVCIVNTAGHMCACYHGHRLHDDGISCSPDVISVEGDFIDCSDLFYAGYISTGVYNIKPYGLGSTTNVLCDQDTEGGGWTVFQRRLDGMENFYRNWNDYKNGFGSLYSEFWMGLDILYLMVTENSDDMLLRVELEGFQNEVAFAEYCDFTIGDEADGFTLHIDRSEAASGLSEDAMYLHNNLKFYTYDESHGEENLAERFQGGWWYRVHTAIHKTCVYACLNQRYFNYELSWNPYAITWHDYRYKHHSWKTTAMKFRPSSFCDCKKRGICC